MTDPYQRFSILKVALPIPLRQVFDYLLPAQTKDFLPLPGMRVLVPFKTQTKVGIIVATAATSDYPLEKLKAAIDFLDCEPLFPKTVLELIQWASQYYHSPLGEVFEAALPNLLRKIKSTTTRNLPSKKTPTSFYRSAPQKSKAITLMANPAQQHAIECIKEQFGTFKTFLLDGVTGSGKTEVYIRLVEEAVRCNVQALILVPEIGLTPQLFMRFQERFTVPIAILNSSVSDKKRLEAWENAKNGSAPIVIGTRLAAFVPLKSPGIFILDEEHDTSFKQQDGFRYHARDLLIMRGSLEQCPVVLGSATPSLETLHNVYTKRFQCLPLPARAGKASMPTVQILDIRHKKLEAGLSAQLIAAMYEQLERKGQILLFLNRRGYAPVWMCFTCGWVANCKNCDAKMTVHYQAQQLKCHHCERLMPLYTNCPACNRPGLKPIGVGTERLESALQKHFPDHTVIRIDRDTTRKKGAMQNTIDRIHNGEANILLGTQMIAKGHHFPNVTLVAILDIDHALFSLDFRSTEKMGQLITQVAGRTGRAERLGHVILQTCHPEHPLLKKILTEGYTHFANALLAERQAIQLPPYSHQALIRAEAKQLAGALNFLNAAKTLLSSSIITTNLTLLGPISAPMERRQGKHRAHLLLQSQYRSALQKLLHTTVPQIETLANTSRIRWSLDVDPLDMY